MANKEKILLAIVIAAVAGTAALDTAYEPVPVPSTKAPTDVPVPPPGAEPVTRWPRPAARSMFDPYSDLISPPFGELPDLPALPQRVVAPVPSVTPGGTPGGTLAAWRLAPAVAAAPPNLSTPAPAASRSAPLSSSAQPAGPESHAADYMYYAYAQDPVMKLNIGIRRRLAPLLENDRQKIELLHSLLFTLPGTPIVYYGDRSAWATTST